MPFCVCISVSQRTHNDVDTRERGRRASKYQIYTTPPRTKHLSMCKPKHMKCVFALRVYREKYLLYAEREREHSAAKISVATVRSVDGAALSFTLRVIPDSESEVDDDYSLQAKKIRKTRAHKF